MISRKEAYRQRTEARLDVIRTRIARIETKIAKTEADIKVRFEQKMEQIRGQYAQAHEKLGELEKDPLENWLEQKIIIDDAMNALNEAVDIIAKNIPARRRA